MAAKPLPEHMLDDWAILLENSEKLPSIIDSNSCVGVGLYGLGRRTAAALSLDPETVGDILFALWRLKRVSENRDETPSQTVAWVKSAIESRAPEEWKQKYNDLLIARADNIGKLTDGIGNDHPIMIAVKAQTLVYTHQNLFLGARLITDVRPVFNDSASEVDELVITHMLTLDYSDGSQRNSSITLAMDQEDIAQLQNQCERAATKILTLKGALKDFPLVVMPDNSEGER